MRRLGMRARAASLLAVVTLVLPAQATNLMDDGRHGAADVAQAGFTSEAADLITREASTRPGWSATSAPPTPRSRSEYGPRLMSALTYTWSDVKRMNADPGAKAKIDQAKASRVQDDRRRGAEEGPDGLPVPDRQDRHPHRPATLGVVWVVIMGFFVAIACLHHRDGPADHARTGRVRHGRLGRRGGEVLRAAARLGPVHRGDVNIVKFTLAAGVMTLVLSAHPAAPVGVGWRMLFAIVATVIAIMFTRPVTSFKSMAGMDPTRHYVGSLLRSAGGTALGLIAGHRLSDRQADSNRGTPLDATASGRWNSERHHLRGAAGGAMMPPLAPPTTVQALTASAERDPRWAGWVGPGQSAIQGRTVVDPARPLLPARVPISPNALPMETGGETSPDDLPPPRPLTVMPTVAGAVAARQPVVADYTAFPPAGWRSGSAVTDRDDRPELQPARRTSVDFRVADRAAETSVAYPTGILVQSEPNLYRPGWAIADRGYLWFPEPQLDANGEETWTPLYHSRAAR